MRLFSRKSKTYNPPILFRLLSRVVNRWTARYQRRLVAALNGWEQQLTPRQKKWVLVLFLSLGVTFFTANGYRRILGHHVAGQHTWQHMTLPPGAPLPTLSSPPMLKDTIHRDSSSAHRDHDSTP